MLANEILDKFVYRPVTRSSEIKVQKVHQLFIDLARELNELVPDSRELAICMSRLEESLDWAEKAVPRE